MTARLSLLARYIWVHPSFTCQWLVSKRSSTVPAALLEARLTPCSRTIASEGSAFWPVRIPYTRHNYFAEQHPTGREIKDAGIGNLGLDDRKFPSPHIKSVVLTFALSQSELRFAGYSATSPSSAATLRKSRCEDPSELDRSSPR